MQKCFAVISFLFLLNNAFPQKVQGKLHFDQGQTYAIAVELKNTVAQQAMGNAIDFTVSGTAGHTYKVTNTTDDNTTLRHAMQRLSFEFDGMGQKRAFNSDNAKDMEGQFGKPIKEMLAKTYDMVIDSNGNTRMCLPEKLEVSKQDDRLAIITNMLRDLTSVVYPPQKGSPSFFQILPGGEVGIGDTWKQSSVTETERSITEYTLTGISDSLITVDFKTTASSVVKAEMMGMETTTNINSIATGKVFLDKTTHIVKEKNITVESNGNTEAMGSTMPINSKTIITIKVKPL